jgi:nucleotide-binding universal stress UspA family protein
MRKILIPVDASAQTEAVMRAVAAQSRHEPIGELHLLQVQAPISSYAGQFLPGAAIRDFRQQEARDGMARARRVLDDATLPYSVHIRVGGAVATIARTAEELGVDDVVLSGDGDGLVGTLLQRLLIAGVIRRARARVVVIKPRRSGLVQSQVALAGS